MRYKGQSHELTIPYRAENEEPLSQQFHAAHEARYGYAQNEAAVEIVTLRLAAVISTTPPALPERPLAGNDASAAMVGRKRVWFEQRPQETTLYAREMLRPGNQVAGPAVVFQYDTTSVVPPGWGAAVDGFGNLILENK